jgi:hypothetical protein
MAKEVRGGAFHELEALAAGVIERENHAGVVFTNKVVVAAV